MVNKLGFGQVFDTLDEVPEPHLYGVGPLWVTGEAGYAYVQYVSDGSSFTETLRVTDNGDLIAEIVPRTGPLATLETVVGTQGELASATDQPAIVQMDGAGDNAVFRPGQSHKTEFLSQATEVIDVTTDIINLSLSTVATMDVTFLDGYEGQQVLLNVYENVGGAVNTNGLTILDVTVDVSNLPAIIVCHYIDGSWLFTSSLKPNTVLDEDGLAIGRNNSVTGPSLAIGKGNSISDPNGGSIVIGINNIITADIEPGGYCGRSNYGYSGYAFGESNKLTGRSFVAGKNNVVGENIRISTTDGITLVVEDGTDLVRAANGSSFIPIDSIVDGVKRSGLGLVTSASTMQDVSGVTYSTANNSTLTVTPAADFVVTLFGKNLRALYQGQQTYGVTVNAQSTRLALELITSDATPSKLTTNGNAQTAAGPVSTMNRLILPDNVGLAGDIVIHAKEQGGSDAAMFKADLLVTNDGVTPALKSGGTVNAVYADTNYLTPTITLNTTGVLPEIEITVTGIAATNIVWHAKLDLSEIKV